jgi:signal transduction histidine kinase
MKAASEGSVSRSLPATSITIGHPMPQLPCMREAPGGATVAARTEISRSIGASSSQYLDVLAEYLRTRSEDALYRASLLSQLCVNEDLGPEDILALHIESLDKLVARLPLAKRIRAQSDAHQFLLEIMITYGVQYRHYLELRLGERARLAETEAALAQQRAQAAEDLEREKTSVLGFVVHEMRTPLTSMRASLQLADRYYASGRTHMVEPLHRRLTGAVDRMVRMTDDLAAATSDTTAPLVVANLMLGEALDLAVEWAQAAASEKQIAIQYAPTPKGLVVLAERDALFSIFGNLLSNAIRYTPQGGRVAVIVDTDDAAVIVAVSDTGVGMAPEVRTHIFDKFYRGPQAAAMAREGVGLGLTLVRMLVAALGARLEVQSEADAGSTFRVFIPVAQRSDEQGGTA